MMDGPKGLQGDLLFARDYGDRNSGMISMTVATEAHVMG